MQSGISASQELHTAFNELVSTPSQLGLLATISNEALVPTTTLSGSADFESDISALSPHLKDNEATYIILRRYPDASDGFIAVTYVPNSAPVRQKMLFASTRLTLVRELGTERFREQIFATEKEELTAQGFVKHDQHTKLAAPLTEEEEQLGAVKRAEQEEGSGTVGKRVGGHAISLPIADDALEKLKALPEADYNLVQLKINPETGSVDLDSTSTSTASGLSSSISNSEPRYSFFKYNHTYNSEELSPIVFIYTCPSSSKIRERMTYAASRAFAQRLGENEAGLEVKARFEATDADEIGEKELNDEFHPQVEVKKAFDRPRRPGRK